MIGSDQIERVRTAVDIVDIIREYVPSLKAAGRTVRGLCPFHSERTPSFHVHPEKRIYKCFGCGESGDVISFISKIEQVGFMDALNKLADQAGIRLQNAPGRQEKEPPNVREKLYRVLEGAKNFYEEKLWDERIGVPARSYLEKRGVKEESARDFHLGYVPTTGGAAFEALVQKGFPIDLCQQAGLVNRSSGGRLYDPLFGRLIFPIFDSFGHVIGFGGRVLPTAKGQIPGLSQAQGDDEGPSYLNSPESPVFKKGESLYGLTQAKGALLQKRQAIVLEGYMDVIGLHQAGVSNAVATLGTAFTNAHAKVLKRYVTEVVAFFDPDEAGRKAAHRSLTPILEEDLFPRVVQTQDSLDPDEIVLEKGREALEALVNNAPDFVDALLQAAEADGPLSLQKKSELAKELIRIISSSPNEILKAEWVSKVSSRLGLQKEALSREVSKNSSRAPETMTKIPKLDKKVGPSPEDECLALLMTHPDLWDRVDLEAGDFRGEHHRRLFNALRELAGRGSATEIGDRLPPEDREWYMQISMDERQYAEPGERLEQLARDLQKMRIQKQIDILVKKLASGLASEEEQVELKSLLRRVKGSDLIIQK